MRTLVGATYAAKMPVGDASEEEPDQDRGPARRADRTFQHEQLQCDHIDFFDECKQCDRSKLQRFTTCILQLEVARV